MTVNEVKFPEPPSKINMPPPSLSQGGNSLNEKVESIAPKALPPLVSLEREPYPDLNHVITALREQLGKPLAKKTDTHILLAIKMILYNERHQRFIYHKELQFDKATNETFAKLRAYYDKESAYEIGSKCPPSGIMNLMTITINEMAALYQRERVTKKKYNQKKELILYSQAHGHIDSMGQLIPCQTLSSELQKREYSADRSFNANTAALTLQHANAETEFLLVRSSRSDNPSRLLKLIQFNILSSLQSANKPGIIESDNKPPVFRMSLLTAQDPHPTRNLIKGLKKPTPKDEATSLDMMQESVDEIWGDQLYRPILVQLDEDHTVTFNVERPLVKNYNLSKTAYDPQIILSSREWSRDATIREFDLLRKIDVAKESTFFGELFQKFSLAVPEDMTPSQDDITSFLDGLKACKTPVYPNDSPLEIKLYMALQSIAISLTHKNIEGVPFLDATSPGLELYYHYYLCELINSSISVQCKAGCDRALIMTAMRLGQKQLEEAYDRIYDFPKDKGVLQEFEEEFKSFCGKFGPPILKVCRGNHWMKGIDKPILNKILNDKITENSIPGMKLIKGT